MHEVLLAVLLLPVSLSPDSDIQCNDLLFPLCVRLWFLGGCSCVSLTKNRCYLREIAAKSISIVLPEWHCQYPLGNTDILPTVHFK